MQPICLDCRLAMAIHETGAFLEQMTEQGPYRIWCADVFQCPGCHVMAAAGFGKQPYMRRQEADYLELRRKYRPKRFWATQREQQEYRMRHAPKVEEIKLPC